MILFLLDENGVDAKAKGEATWYKELNYMIEVNRVPLLSSTLSCFNIYELENKLLEKRVLHGINELKNGEIRDELEELYFTAAYQYPVKPPSELEPPCERGDQPYVEVPCKRACGTSSTAGSSSCSSLLVQLLHEQ